MESLSMVSHTNALIKNRETIDINLYEQFIKYLDASPKTVETYKKSLKQMFSYLLSNNVTSPRCEDLLAYRNYLFAKGLKPTTIQNYITAAKIFFTWTNEEGYYPNIAEHIKGAKIDKEHKKDYLTGAQVKNVLSCVDFGTTQGLRDYAIIVLMITGGLRTVEVTRANIGDIRNIGESTVLFIQGKGKIEKNDYVKLPDAVEKAIRTYLSSRKDDKSDTSPLFVNLTCALGMDHSPHETRHTFATLAKEAKVDEYCLKLILGHNIADLTERVYTHRKKEQLLEEIKKIE